MPVTDVFGAIASPVRRQILDILREGPLPAGAIAQAFDLNRPAISEHLQVLRLAGLVTEEAQGRQRIYSLSLETLAKVHEWLHPFEHYWNERISALNQVLSKRKK